MNSSTYMAYFFIIFIVIGSLFLLNLFVGVIFLNYHKAEKKEEKRKGLSHDQIKWIEMQRLVIKEKPDFGFIKIPHHKIRLFFYKIVEHDYFETGILLCIIANIIVMALSFEGSSASYKYVNLFYYKKFKF